MLNYLLGWTVGLGSLGLYLTGFLLPETRRKNDAIWSGTGLIYALSILANGDRTPAGLQIGELAGVLLLGWLGWQTLQQRRQLSKGLQTPIPASAQGIFLFVKQGWGRLVSTYSSPTDDGTDILVTGVKKVSALVGGSKTTSVIDLPERFSAPTANLDADLDEDAWGEGESPMTEPSTEPSSSTVELPSRFSGALDEPSDTPLNESSLEEVSAVAESDPGAADSASAFIPSVVIPQGGVTEVETEILPADAAENPRGMSPSPSLDSNSAEAAVSEGSGSSSIDPDNARQIGEVALEDVQPLAQVMPSDPAPEPTVDLSDRFADPSVAVEKDEDWPPKEII